MDFVIAFLGWTLFSIGIVTGLILNLVGLFGNWVILVTVACGWLFSRFQHFSLTALGIMFLIACLGEIIEATAAGFGARRFGGSKGASVSAFVGGIVGALLGTPIAPLVGTLIGACLGAFVAAVFYEYAHLEKQVGAALWTGFGAVLGRVAGLLGKFAAGLAMLATAALSF